MLWLPPGEAFLLKNRLYYPGYIYIYDFLHVEFLCTGQGKKLKEEGSRKGNRDGGRERKKRGEGQVRGEENGRRERSTCSIRNESHFSAKCENQVSANWNLRSLHIYFYSQFIPSSTLWVIFVSWTTKSVDLLKFLTHRRPKFRSAKFVAKQTREKSVFSRVLSPYTTTPCANLRKRNLRMSAGDWLGDAVK